jgi:hypothetical protein
MSERMTPFGRGRDFVKRLRMGWQNKCLIGRVKMKIYQSDRFDYLRALLHFPNVQEKNSENGLLRRQ